MMSWKVLNSCGHDDSGRPDFFTGEGDRLGLCAHLSTKGAEASGQED